MDQHTLNNHSNMLEASGVSKFFSNVPALSDVSIVVRPGQITGLVGHNGAGKSTLLKILSGVYRPDRGSVRLNGETAELNTPSVAQAKGISTVHQELSLLPNLTVTQNVFLARERARLGMLQRDVMRNEAQAMVEKFDLDVDVRRNLGDYSVATRQLLELAIATHRKAQFLLLDEPTTSLEGAQIDKLLETIRDLADEQDVGILLIDHKLDEIYAVADTIVALVDGRIQINAPIKSIKREEVIRAITGDDAAGETLSATLAPAGSPASETGKQTPLDSQITLKVTNLRTNSGLRDISLTAYSGRVLGIYGLVGAGRSELLRTLIGLDTIVSGQIELFGRPYKPRNPASAQRAGIVYLTEERKQDGIIPPLDSRVNVSLPILEQFRRWGLLNLGKMGDEANKYLDTFKVYGDRSRPVVNLSGGNQQKVLFARVLAQEPKVLLLDEPTKGVDIGVKVDIHRHVRKLAHEEGLTVIVVSSEEEEILEVSDEVAVFVNGTCDGKSEPAENLTAAQLRRAAWIPE